MKCGMVMNYNIYFVEKNEAPGATDRAINTYLQPVNSISK